MKRLFVILLLLLAGCSAIQQTSKLLEEGNYVDAKNKCLQILAADSLNADAHLLLGRCYLHEGALDSAIQSFTTAWKIQPESKVTPIAKTALLTTQIQQADTLLTQENKRPARDLLLDVVAVDSTHAPALLRLGTYYFDAGLLDRSRDYFLSAGRHAADSVTVAEKLSEIAQRNETAQTAFENGYASYQKYQYKKAVEQLDQALKAKPDHKNAQYYRALSHGALLYLQGSKPNLWEAIRQFGTAMTLRPESGEPHYFMGMAYEKKNRN